MLIRSFGFKYGFVPCNNAVYSARGLKNPHNISYLRDLTGLDLRIKDYVLSDPKSQELINRIISSYREHPTDIGIGCFGGKHRSVVIAEEVGRILGVKPCHLNLET